MKVDITELQKTLAALNEINTTPFDEIEWQQDGKALEFSVDLLERWKYAGLNNIDFIRYDYYLAEG